MGRVRAFAILIAVLFLVTVASLAQSFTMLHSFCSQGNCPDGAYPYAGLLQGSDGNFYGTTYEGGANNDGTIFKLAPSGTLTTLYNFCSQHNCADGEYPYAGLVQGSDGNFYGTTSGGGTARFYGTVFRVTPGGTLTTLYSFCSQPSCADGADPIAGLVLGSDGSFYGTTTAGGTRNLGTIFKITPSGGLTTLYSFGGQPDGAYPYAVLVQGSDGNFYGTTSSGGFSNQGTIFRITPGGSLTRLYSFCTLTDCADGYTPFSGLVQGSDGNFYGTTSNGGAENDGTVFRVTPSGGLITLHSFCSQTDCADGMTPYSTLVQSLDGNFYGTTHLGGSDIGTIFRITPGGVLTTLYTFSGLSDGAKAFGGLIQARDGNFYGTAYFGGGNNFGTVFRLLESSTQFSAVTACRLVDTRQTGGPITGGSYRSFNLPQLAMTKCSSLNLSAAVLYSLNVTVVPRKALSYLTIWPTGAAQPVSSTMNSPDGRVKANAAVVPAGAGGGVNVYVTDTSDVILDINGYFQAPGTHTYQFYPLTPCRVVDTRSGSNQPHGLGPPRLQASQIRELPILSSPCLEGITNPLAYSFNVTVVPNPAGQLLSYLVVWPAGQTQPVVSTLNNPTATVVANAAIVPAAPNGDIDVYAYNSTDLIMDINGYFAAPGQSGLSLYPIAPCRVLDTRQNNAPPFMNESTVNVVGSACAPPSNAQAYVFNATVVPPASMPYLTLWADGQQEPVVSTLNAYDGLITSNMAIVPTTNGSIDAWAQESTHLILDISGYFAP